MKRTYKFIALTIGLLVLLSACSADQSPPVAPATDKLTFLFFYTDG